MPKERERKNINVVFCRMYDSWGVGGIDREGKTTTVETKTGKKALK